MVAERLQFGWTSVVHGYSGEKHFVSTTNSPALVRTRAVLLLRTLPVCNAVAVMSWEPFRRWNRPLVQWTAMISSP